MKKLFILLTLVLAIPVTTYAADFRAEVDHDQVQSGDSLTLQLTLSGAKAKQDPDLSNLGQSFNIVSEGQSSNTEIFNGNTTSSTGWVLTLVPKADGQAIIPAIAIDTDQGLLRSDPVTITVSHTTQQQQPIVSNPTVGAPDRAITVSAEVDNAAPYKNQPVHYTVRAYVRANFAGASMQDPVLDNAVIEKQGDPQMRDETINGRPVRVIVFHYLITPLQPGKITIPPAVLQGQVEDLQSAARSPSPFDENSFSDPFRMLQALQNAMPGFAPMKPFSVGSNSITLNVAAPPVAMDLWLPLDNLKIHEDWDEKQQARVGEPLTRKISLLADGGVATQLPSLEPQQNHTDFKVYADKPRTGNDTDHATGTSYAWREESYSLIPTKYGHLVLPAIRVPYWNLKTNSLAYADLPQRIVDVAPGTTTTAQNQNTQPQAAAQPSQTQIQQPSSPAVSRPALPAPQGMVTWLYATIIVLLAVLVFAIFWAVSMQRQINRIATGKQAPVDTPKPVSNTGKSIPSSLDSIATPQELSIFLQTFAQARLNLPASSSLETIFAAWPKPVAANDDRRAVANDLGAALYAGKTIDIEELKSRVQSLIVAMPQGKKAARKDGEKLPGLNPE